VNVNSNEDLDNSYLYSDSDTDLAIYRGVKLLKAVRAVIHNFSNVGNFVRLRNGHMVAVHINEEGVYYINIPEVD